MFKEANKIFLLVGFFIIISLFWVIIKYCDFSSSEIDDEKWYEEYGISLNIWPEGEPEKDEWEAILKDCLVKSDNLSLKRCQYILEQIDSYDDCVIAGFPVIESNLGECKTSDNRLFINE